MGYRIWPATSGPATQNTDTDSGSTGGVALGAEFYVSSACNVTHIHYWKANNGGSTPQKVGAIYAVGGAKVTGTDVTFTDSGTGVWQTAALASPVALTINARYRVVVFFANNSGAEIGYSSTATYWSGGGGGASGITNGPLNAVNASNSTNGQDTYNYGASISNPTNTFNDTNYWVDVTVEDAATQPIKTRWQGIPNAGALTQRRGGF